MNGPVKATEGTCMTQADALRLAKQLAAERPDWVCEVMQDPCSDEWLLCLYHRERWEQFVRYDPALLDGNKGRMEKQAQAVVSAWQV